jgi:hypothetical protein
MSKSGPQKPLSIITQELCAYGCLTIAKYQSVSGKLMCETSSSKCPEIKRKNSESGKNSYLSGRKPHKQVYENLPQETKDRMAWVRGKTKITHPEYHKKRIETYSKNSKIYGFNKNIRGVALDPLKRWKRNNILYHDSFGNYCTLESFHELKVANELDKNNILWIRPSRIKLKNTEYGIHYEPDFYLIDYDVYLDPKSKWCGSPVDKKYQGYAKQNNQLNKIKQCEIENNIKIVILWNENEKSHSWLGILDQIEKYLFQKTY